MATRAVFRRGPRAVDGEDATTPAAPWGWRRLAVVFAVPLMVAQAFVLTPWALAEVEDRLSRDARSDLQAAGIDTADLSVEFHYRDGAVVGTLPSGIEPFMVEDALGGGVIMGLEVRADSPPARPATPGQAGSVTAVDPVQPTEVTVAHDGVRVVIMGSVASEAQGNVLLDAVDLLTGRADIENWLTVTRFRAAPGSDDRIADLLAALEAVDPADRWRLHLTDRSLTVEAQTADQRVAAAVADLGRSLRAVPTQVILYERFDDPLDRFDRAPIPGPTQTPAPAAGTPSDPQPDAGAGAE